MECPFVQERLGTLDPEHCEAPPEQADLDQSGGVLFPMNHAAPLHANIIFRDASNLQAYGACRQSGGKIERKQGRIGIKGCVDRRIAHRLDCTLTTSKTSGSPLRCDYPTRPISENAAE